MKRRTCLRLMLAAAGGAVMPAFADTLANPDQWRPIQLHVDLAVDPAKEEEMLDIFQKSFRPAAAQQPGYIDSRMLKLQSTLRGPAPPGANYQFVLTFASEELRQKWISTEIHKKLWPTIENTLTSKNYSRLLYEVY
jgi:antibiotic biosynthesis monooxygenase (ABM) superfamily enzyme